MLPIRRRLPFEDEDIERHTRHDPAASSSGAAKGGPEHGGTRRSDPSPTPSNAPSTVPYDTPKSSPAKDTEWHDISSIRADSSQDDPLDRDYDGDDSSNDTIPYYAGVSRKEAK